MRRTYLTSWMVLSLAVIAGAGACDGGAPAQPTSVALAPSALGSADASAALPFSPESPAVYVAKVKNILVGLPPTDSEVKAVTANPAQLKSLIDGWMALPQYQTKMLRFFELAFQQTQVAITDFADQAYPRQADVNSSTSTQLVQNATESFGRTVLALIQGGRPLTDAFTTQSVMLTPALMELYAFFDAWQVDDAGTVTDRFKLSHPGVTLSLESSQGPIPMAQTLDPTSPNYMHWYDPDVGVAAALTGAGCAQDPIVFSQTSGMTLHYLLYGAIDNRKNPTGSRCGVYGGTAAAPQLTTSDFDTWKMVSIRAPHAGEAPTAFYDLPTLRAASELVLTIPRVGFFSTPAFFANWQTNTSNQARVTMNQTLIVALGAQVDGTDTTIPSSTPGLDTVHAASPACLECHRTLDPTRSILASTYSWNYHQQTDTAESAQKGLFAFQGVVQPLGTVSDLGTVLAQHPLFASAWVQKLCAYVNSTACDPTDPEFLRVVGVFKSSGYSWTALVRELLASPLTTYATPTQTATTQGEIVAVSRRDHLCAALNNRLGFADICGLDATSKAVLKTAIPEIVSGLPSDGYGRGAVAPVLPNQPTLFYRAGTENICEAAAALVIDVPSAQQAMGTKQWSSGQSTAAITDFVQIIMALTPSDPRYAQALALLQAHFAAAMKSGSTATAALESTFVAACLAPSAVLIGM